MTYMATTKKTRIKSKNGRCTRSTYFNAATDAALLIFASRENRSIANSIDILVREALAARGVKR